MARPPKEGVDYFNVDTSFDPETEAFIARFGNDGIAFLLRLWQWAYRRSDGRVDCSLVFRRTILEQQMNISGERFDEILNFAMQLELVDRDEWKQHQILTSRGIQKRLAQILSVRKNARNRKQKNSSPENPEPPALFEIVRSKGKERKGKEIKENNNTRAAADAPRLVVRPEPSPIYGECKLFRASGEELARAEAQYKKLNLSLNLLPFAIAAVDDWLHNETYVAKKARKQPNHYRRLWSAWAIEAAKRMQAVSRDGGGESTSGLTPARAQQIIEERKNRVTSYGKLFS